VSLVESKPRKIGSNAFAISCTPEIPDAASINVCLPSRASSADIPGMRPPEVGKRAVQQRYVARIVGTLLVAILSHGIATAAAQYLWFRTSSLYGETMYIVRASLDVQKAIGASIVSGWPQISRSVYRGVGEVTVRLPIRGDRGGATVRLRAKNRGGNWEYQQLEATTDTSSSLIDLMPHPWRPQELVIRGAGRLYFVGMGELSHLSVDDLAREYADRYKVDITVLPPLSYQGRSEWAEKMIRALKAGYPQLANDPQAVILAVTEIDMDWFSWRDEGRFAVVSTAGLTSVQFRKQLSKCLGLLWFELPMSTESRSVLYDAVGGRVDLDLMSDDF
jgi:hypothetical protein